MLTKDAPFELVLWRGSKTISKQFWSAAKMADWYEAQRGQVLKRGKKKKSAKV